MYTYIILNILDVSRLFVDRKRIGLGLSLHQFCKIYGLHGVQRCLLETIGIEDK